MILENFSSIYFVPVNGITRPGQDILGVLTYTIGAQEEVEKFCEDLIKQGYHLNCHAILSTRDNKMYAGMFPYSVLNFVDEAKNGGLRAPFPENSMN